MKQAILDYLLTIPKWKVTTYKNIWIIFSCHPRKVSQTKFPEIYPCYKVIASSWKISWYNTERWIVEKIEKLKNDGIEVVNWVIDQKFII